MRALTGGKEEEALALMIEIFANREECHESSNDSVAQELFRQLYMCIESCVKGMLLYDDIKLIMQQQNVWCISNHSAYNLLDLNYNFVR